MKIALPWEQFSDDEGRPLVGGRVSVYKHDSDILAEVFTLEGDIYSAAPNPFLTADDGRIPTIWFEAAVVDVRLEKQNSDGSFEPLDTFQAGFDMPKAANSTFVYGMADLKDVSTDVGIVSVVGYYNQFDAPVRNYVWDPNCSLDPDGGVIVESNTGEEGRWILLWDDEYLPSSLYGVFAGVNEANIAAFLSYPDYVGTYQVRTPPSPRFLGGDYVTAGVLISTRAVYFDQGARFPYAEIECQRAIIPSNTSYVADFYFTGKDVSAHSSWFMTVDSFLTCNAKEMVVDDTNYFFDNTVKLNRVLEDKTIIYTANKRLPVTYSNSGRITFNNSNIVGTGIFDSTDLISFVSTDFRDDWFSVLTIDFSQNVICHTVSLNNIRLSNFRHVHNYVNALKYDGQTTVDLAGRSMTSWTNDFATEIRNAFVDTLDVDMSGADIVMKNVHINNLTANCRYLTVSDGSDVSFPYQPVVNAFWGNDSRIHSSAPWTDTSLQAVFDNCYVATSFNYVPDNETLNAVLSFEGCNIQENVVIKAKSLKMHRCSTKNATIQVYPYKEDNKYKMYVDLQDNTFDNSNPVEFTKLKVSSGGTMIEDENVYGIIVDWTIVGNSFVGNNEGLRCRFWQHRLGTENNRLFIAFSSEGSIVYSGNTGKCPADTAKGLGANNGDQLTPSTVHYVNVDGTHYVTLFKEQKVRLMPKMKEDLVVYNWDMEAVGGSSYCYKYYYDGNQDYTLNQSGAQWIYPWCVIWENSDNGDFFSYGFSKYGHVDQDSGYPASFWIWYYN